MAALLFSVRLCTGASDSCPAAEIVCQSPAAQPAELQRGRSHEQLRLEQQ